MSGGGAKSGSSERSSSTGIGRAVGSAYERRDAGQPVDTLVEDCPVELVLTIQRIREWPKNPNATTLNAQQGGTISEFELTKNDEKNPLVTGFILEAAGPSSTTEGSDQRISAGIYSLIKNPASVGPYRLVQLTQVLSGLTFGERNCINIHIGNAPVNLEGCLCPGINWEERGVTKKNGKEDRSNAYPYVISSGGKLAEIQKHISKYGKIRSETTYDGSGAYKGSAYYCNVLVIIRDIRPNFVYFALYYTVPDKAFERAAETWKRQVEALSGFRNDRDEFLMFPVSTEADFNAAWDKVLQQSKNENHFVKEGRVFSHASKGDEQDGLEFKKDAANDGTTSKVELSALPVLNWAQGAKLYLHGCNTGVVGERGWAPAEVLSSSQNVAVVGQSGFAYFSTDPDSYAEIDDKSKDVYLWAFRRNLNATLYFFGDGSRMPEVIFYPKK